MDPASILTAIAAVLAYKSKTRVDRFETRVDHVQAQLTVIDGNVVEVGARIDGRLSQLLATSGNLRHAEGMAEGAKAERKRVADVNRE